MGVLPSKFENGYCRIWPSSHMRQWEREHKLSGSLDDCGATHVDLHKENERIWKIERMLEYGNDIFSLQLVGRDCQRSYLSTDSSGCAEHVDFWSEPMPWKITEWQGKPDTYLIQKHGKSCKPYLVYDHTTGDNPGKAFMNDRTDMGWTIMPYSLDNIKNKNWAKTGCNNSRDWCDKNVLEPQCKTKVENLSHAECKKWCERNPHTCDESKKHLCTLSLDNMSHDICVNEYCINNPNKCAKTLENLCNAGNLEDNKKLCGCFLPKSDMEKYIDDAYGALSKGQTTIITKEPPKCWYAPCTRSYKWAQDLTSGCTDSQFVQCIANADLKLQGSEVKRINTSQIQVCGNEGSSEDIEKLIREQEERQKQFENNNSGNGRNTRKYSLIGILMCCIMVLMSIVLFILYKNR